MIHSNVETFNAMTDGLYVRQLETLLQSTHLLTSLDVDEVMYSILRLTVDAVGATNGSFFLFEDDERTVKRFISARELSPEGRAFASSSVLERGVAGWVRKHKATALVDDTASDERWLLLDDQYRVRSAVCVPLFVDGNLRGIMTLEHTEPSQFDAGAVRLAEATTRQAAASLRNAELFHRVDAQQRQLEGVLNTIMEPLMVVDPDLNISLMNPAADNLLSALTKTINAFVGMNLSALSEHLIFARIIDALGTVSSQDTISFDQRVDTLMRDYIVTIRQQEKAGAERAGFVIVLHDVTVLKDLTRLKSHTIKMASHDLKNPLGVLIGYLDLIDLDIANQAVPDPSYVDNMHRVITRMETLIATLLDSQRSESNGGMQRAAIDPNELLNAVIEDNQLAAQQRKHTITQDISPLLRPLLGDMLMLRQAINNLVGNAIKYTPEGGLIAISARTEEDRFYFSVADNGYGIPEHQQDGIFTPYFRGEQPQGVKIEGSGVGLSLVKEVIERHGGQVWFQSAEGVGSTFSLWLPILD
jgi:signal transduction histidine kinase